MIYNYDENKRIPFISRENETKFLQSEILDSNVNRLFISGESGTGKTTLVHEAIKRTHAQLNGKMNYIYFDAYKNMLNDINISNFQYLFALDLFTMSKGSSDYSYSFYSDLSFKKFVNQSEISLNTILNLIKNASSFIPNIGDIVNKLLPEYDTKDSLHLPQDFNLLMLITKYIQKLSKVTTVLVIDNYQFLNDSAKNSLNYMVRQVDCNFTYITILRLEKGVNEIRLPYKGVFLHPFSEDEVHNLITNIYGPISNDLVSKLYSDSDSGNLKELELIIRRSDDITQYGKISKSDNYVEYEMKIEKLKREIGVLTSIFNSGIRLEELMSITKEFSYFNADKKLVTDALTNNPYVSYRNDLGVISKPHERVISTLLEDYDDDRYIEMMNCCKNYLDREIETANTDERFMYLMSIIISLKTTDEILSNTLSLGRYLMILNESQLYDTILSVYNKMSQITTNQTDIVVKYLPIYCLPILLDTFEKTSSFELGLDFYNRYIGDTGYRLYHAKYLLHSYKYDEAEKILSNYENLEQLKIYLNLIQHRRYDKEAQDIVISLINEEQKYINDDNYFLILRNSAHLFDSESAIKNLKKCITYFNDNKYYKAMSLNNLALVLIQENLYIKAEALLRKAVSIFDSLISVEAYQPTFNLGLIKMLSGEYNIAIEYMTKALEIMPSSLSFDRIKFYNNIYICKFLLANSIEEEKQCIKKLKYLLIGSNKNPDPWLHFQSKINFAQMQKHIDSKESKEITLDAYLKYNGNPEIYGVHYKVSKNNVEYNYTLATSPHWRC
jgi:tetratricopeptide (TPR) repeat protein